MYQVLEPVVLTSVLQQAVEAASQDWCIPIYAGLPAFLAVVGWGVRERMRYDRLQQRIEERAAALEKRLFDIYDERLGFPAPPPPTPPQGVRRGRSA